MMYAFEELNKRSCDRPDDTLVVEGGMPFTTHDLFVLVERARATIVDMLGSRTTGARIALCARPGIQRLAFVIAIWAEGGVYVPFDPDPSQPLGRMSDMVRASRPRLILVDESQHPLKKVGEQYAIPVSDLPTVSLLDRDVADTRDLPHQPSSASSYIVFTSGSTGAPKAVELPHSTVDSLLQSLSEVFSSAVRVLQSAPVTFDMSLKETFGAIVGGGVLIIDPGLNVKDPEAMLGALVEADANLVCLTPTAYHSIQLTAERSKKSLAHVDFVCGGEPLRISRQERLNSGRIFNHYGPSETHVALSYEVSAEEYGEIPNGAELGDVRVHILSSGLRRVPEGAIGEVWIGGARVGLGYFGNSRSTAERFCPDPFASTPGARMYRTGDLARRLPSGSIHVVGREDHQTKIRGHRVEPAEVATALERHPLVRGALVRGITPQDRDGVQLVAWLTGHPTGVENIRHHLAYSLPEHMIPTRLVWIDEFPLTPHGKVDEQRLLALLAQRPGRLSDPPQGDVERAIATIWESVLQTDNVSRDDNFFAMGGNSLDAARVTFRIRDELKQELPVHALFEAPVLKDLAVHPSLRRRTEELPRSDRGSPLPASPGQLRMWFHQQQQPTSTIYNMPLVLRTAASLDVGRLARAVATVVEQNEVLRTNIQLDRNHNVVQVIRPDASYEFEDFDLSFPCCEKITDFVDLVEAAVAVPFRLDIDAPLRMYHATLGDGSHAVAFVAHHVTLDGWSVDLFARQITRAYDGQRGKLPSDARHYADWVLWRASQDDNSEGLSYWNRQLSQAWENPLLPLPKHSVRGEGCSISGILALDDLRANTAEMRTEGHSEFNIILAFIQLALHRMTGNDDIRIGVPVSGRTHAATERMLGYFTNMVVIRQRLSSGQTLADVTSATSATVRDALEHQDIPFDDVVTKLNPPRGDFGDTRLFEVCVAFSRGRHARSEWALEGAVPEFFSVSPRGVPFPLTLFVEAPNDTTAGTLRLVWDEQVVSRSQIASLRAALNEVFAQYGAGRISWQDGESIGARQFGDSKTILHVLEKNAFDWPQRIFLEDVGGSTVTYDETLRLVRRMAAWLLDRGLKSGDYVMIQEGRTVSQTVMMLAVMMAGLCYVPIRPDEPPRRLRSMIKELQVAAVLRSSSSPQVPQFPGVMTLHVDPLTLNFDVAEPRTTEVSANQCAYALFTSGTTGLPKAALIRHENLRRLGEALDEKLAVCSGSRILAFSNTSFDASLLEFSLALTSAGTLLFIDPATRMDPADLADSLSTRRVDVTLLTPTVLRALPELEGWSGILLSGGEPLDCALAGRFLPLVKNGKFWNAYGPTEATVVATLHRVTPDDLKFVAPGAMRSIPIGMALDGTSARVLRADGSQAGVGETGELVISGALVGAGYVGRPELTRERFSVDSDGTRSYRTGDRAHVNHRGEFVHDGRVDDQVKLGGQRVELGEVEAAFCLVTGAAAAVAVVGQEDNLQIFYVGETLVKENDVRGKLLEYLPPSMIPQRAQRVAELPVLPSGKIDRVSLSGSDVPSHRPVSALSRGDSESMTESISSIWRDVLDSPSLTPDDRFFDMGGNSIALLRVAARMRQELGISVTVGDLMEAQTVRGLTTRLRKPSRVNRSASRYEIVLNPPLLPVVRAIQNLATSLYEFGINPPKIVSAGFEMSDVGRTMSEACERTYLRANLTSAHVIFVGWSIGGVASLEMARQAEIAGHSTSVLLLDTIRPGSHLFRVGARVTARRIAHTSFDEMTTPAPWLRNMGFTDDFGVTFNSADWVKFKRQIIWQLSESSDYRVGDLAGRTRVVLASGSKGDEELQRLRRAWKAAGVSDVITVAQDHEQLLVSSFPFIADQVAGMMVHEERK
jgi:amino acid adenylation domain-containing protein